MREGFVFYNSFAEAIRCLPEEYQLEAFNAVVDYAINGTMPETGISAAIVKLVKPQIDANNARYENGKKGGRRNQTATKPEPNQNQTETKPEPNETMSEPKEKEKVKVKDKEKESANADKKKNAAITLTLNGGDEYPVTLEDVEEYRRLYPSVDIMQELRKMRGWCLDNPTKRKTKAGIRRFIGGWLSKEQGKAKDPLPNRGQERGAASYADIARQSVMQKLGVI